jgi:hypothetical protein
METVFDECSTEEQCSDVHFLWGKGLNAKDIHKKKCFLLTVGSVCHIEWFTTGSRNSLKDV